MGMRLNKTHAGSRALQCIHEDISCRWQDPEHFSETLLMNYASGKSSASAVLSLA